MKCLPRKCSFLKALNASSKHGRQDAESDGPPKRWSGSTAQERFIKPLIWPAEWTRSTPFLIEWTSNVAEGTGDAAGWEHPSPHTEFNPAPEEISNLTMGDEIDWAI